MSSKNEAPVLNRVRVKQPFLAKLVAGRRRETFDAGELLLLVDGAETNAEMIFVRINGLRPSRGVECHYALESGEFREKTEAAGKYEKRLA